jgi:transcription antitermination protein NusB
MGARRTARERALQALYQLDMAKGTAQEALASAWASEPEEGSPDPDALHFAEDIVHGVVEHLAEIDALIESHSHNWRVDRMARIDRNVLRLAIYELKYRVDIPRNVTLNEAIELGKMFGAEGSSAFINGLLDRIAASLGKV